MIKTEIKKFNFPTEKIPASRKSPKNLIIYSLPKVGKTSIIADLKDCLLIDLENSSDALDAIKIKVSNIRELNELGKQLQAEKPYKIIAIDTITQLEEWCIEMATNMYKSSPIGKNFKGNSVLELPMGSGYYWLREAFKKAMDFISTWAEHIIFLGHLRDKMLEKEGKEIASGDLDLTGKIKSMACARADAIAYLYRKTESVEKGKAITPRYLNFTSKSEIISGSRFAHLKGDIKISEKIRDGKTVSDDEEGEIKTYWERIYVE